MPFLNRCISVVNFKSATTFPSSRVALNFVRAFSSPSVPVYRFPPRQGAPQLVAESQQDTVAQPVVIVLQEWWGVDDQVKAHAQRVADVSGAIAVVPDLYNGKIGANAEEASHLMSNLDWTKALGELDELTSQLREEEFKSRKIASLGFCMGGGLSLALAAKLGEMKRPLDACIAFYGTPSKEFINISQIPVHTPVQAHFGQEDSFKGFSDSATALDLERVWMDAIHLSSRLSHQYRPEAHVFVYPKVGHAFMNNIEMQRRLFPQAIYQENLVKQVWDKVGSFLREKLTTSIL